MAAARPLVWGPLVFAVVVTAAGTGTVCGSHPFHLPAGLTDVEPLQTVSGKPHGRFHLERGRGKLKLKLFTT